MTHLATTFKHDLARYAFFVEERLPHRLLFSRQQARFYGTTSYLEVLEYLYGAYPFRRYLEIGVNKGTSFSLSKAEFKCGVDPSFTIRHPLSGNIDLQRTTSDEFFAGFSGEPFDCVFVDGLHRAEQASRDLFNSFRILNANGLIVLHDTAPFNRLVASATRYTSLWAGDVYRAVAAYAERSPSDILTLLVPPTGLTLIKSPRRFLALADSPLPASRLPYDDCMRLVLRNSHKISDMSMLLRILNDFYPLG